MASVWRQFARLREAAAFRLAASVGVLVAAAMLIIPVIFFFQAVHTMDRRIDARLIATSNRIVAQHEAAGGDAVKNELDELLSDDIQVETGIYLLTDPAGTRIAGNLDAWPAAATPIGRPTNRNVVRNGHPSTGRLLPRRLDNGNLLVVGRDMEDQQELEQLAARAAVISVAFALAVAVGAGAFFRRQIEGRIASIRNIAHRVEGGDLASRIPASSSGDEFSRLSEDINGMLDRIQQLMDGVRHVSNAIAHDLRTPLGRIRGQLDEALRPGAAKEDVSQAVAAAIDGIDDLIVVFEKLLQIAEAESGTRRQTFEPVVLGPILAEIAELYDATAEEKGITIKTDLEPGVVTLGDKNLLAGAIANLADNALKYAGRGATVELRAFAANGSATVTVRDDGPGIPAAERSKVAERFYRLDSARSQPGNGLGMSIVSAVASLHHGILRLEDGNPGLLVRIVLPLAARNLSER